MANDVPIQDSEARSLADAINRMSVTAPTAEAQRFIDTALSRAPHPLVLNAAGGYVQRMGQAARARELYQRAISLDGNSPVLWLNLATACRLLGDSKAEAEALEGALVLEPRYVAALLQKAALLERQNRPLAAVQVFEAALACIPPGQSIPPQLSQAVGYARQVVAANNQALAACLERELESVRRLHADADQHRYEAYRDLLLGRRRAYSSLPKDAFFPYLPAIEFFPRDATPWLDTLEEATEAIAAEAGRALQHAPADFTPYVSVPPGTPVDEWADLNNSLAWSTYSLWQDGAPVSAHQQHCPVTAATLAKLPLCDIPGYAPGAYFSVLRPHTRLPPHTGTTNTRCLVHLPLVIPAGCCFRVGAQTRSWERGKAWVFDDTIEHEAWNDSDQIRIILIFDIWNPLLSAAERDLVRAATVARGAFYGADSPVMASR